MYIEGREAEGLRVRMATVDSGVICDLAYFDRFDRLCMFGVETAGPVRTLRAGIHRFSIVIRVHNRDPHDDPDVAVFLTLPEGDWRVAEGLGEFVVESRGEYLLIHMPGVALQEEGLYRVEVACGRSQVATCEVHVLGGSRWSARHSHDTH